MASITLVKEIIKADSEEPKTENVIETEESSKTVEMQTPTGEQKEIYLIIFYQRDEEEKKDFAFNEDCKNLVKTIINKKIKTTNNKYAYKKVLKYKHVGGKKNVELIFFIGEKEKYVINFEIKGKIFIYDVELKKYHKILDNIPPDIIDQQTMEYKDKLDLFLEALNQNEEEDKIKELYQETIELYSLKSNYSLLISLFTKVYKEKKLCDQLLNIFYDMNIKLIKDKKENNKPNPDRNEKLGDQFNSKMAQIASESESLINDYQYDPIRLKGIIICYLNYYDYNTFEIFMNKLYSENRPILFEILLLYYSQFFKPVKKEENAKEFFVNFFVYIILKKDFSFLNIGFTYISNLENFIVILDKTKDKIFNKYIKENKKSGFKPIELVDSLKISEDKIETIIDGIVSINNYSKKINNLLAYFKIDFWKSLFIKFNNPDLKSFQICLDIRKVFREYYNIINSVCDKEKDKEIIKSITDFYNIDEFAYLINESIKKFFYNNKGKLDNSEILGCIQKYNPFFKESEYKYKREAYFLDYLVFKYDINSDDDDVIQAHKKFIETFQKLEYEDIFKDNMIKFIEEIGNKINDISSFGTVLELIRIDKIKEKVAEFIEKLKYKYELVFKPEFEKLKENRLKKPIEIIAKFEKLIFDHEDNTDFLEKNISKLKSCFLIYNRLMIICKGDKYKKMKDYIIKQYLENIENIDNIIALIDSLEKNDKENFLKELFTKCEFTRDEFYSTEDNKKINLLYALYDHKKIKKVSGNIETILNEITNDIDKEEIERKKIEEFFCNSEKVIKRRLELIKLVFNNFAVESSYDKLKIKIDSIKRDIKLLNRIRKSLSFQRESHRDDIVQMVDVLNILENIKIKEYNTDSITGKINKLKNLESDARRVELVQNFLLFNVIYENSKGNNQESRFNNAMKKLQEIKKLFEANEKPDVDEIYKQNKEIFDTIKRKLINNEKKSEQFFKDFKANFNIGENKELIEDLTILFNSKKYELDMKSIIYFFNSLNKDDEWNKKLSKKYEKLSEMDLRDLKENLSELKKDGIYDYLTNNNYSRLFNSLYGKKEAIDFLHKKMNTDITELIDRIDPNNPTITVKKINDTKKCIEVFNKFINLNGNLKIFKYIKGLNPEAINCFVSYSKIYSMIVELDRNDNSTLKIFDKIDSIIKDAEFLFLQKKENFSYGINNKISIDELIHLKNKINISEKDINTEEEKDKEKEKKDILKIKSKKLLFFKNLVNNMEIIYENMQILRAKGNNLPIEIKIIVQYDKINEADYYLDQKKSSFTKIETFLLNAKDDYIKKLDFYYKEKISLRYLYGMLFINFVGYLDSGSTEKVEDIFRYILNKNKDEEIKKSNPLNPQIKDYVQNYNDYNKNSFENISDYLTALFEINGTSLKKHYKSMLLLDHNRYKGIYLHECKENSIGKFIYELFLQKIGKRPIAQNILITSKETSNEEIQAYLYRAVLCDYNTLFVVEVNESLSEYQQGIMYNFLDELLIYRLGKYKSANKGINTEKGKTYEYLDSCIVFIYENKNKDLSIVNEIAKLDKQEIQIENDFSATKEENKILLNKQIDTSNVVVISSDICGLGKSFKIKKMIKEKKQKYFHFPLGGILTKKVISEKILNLLKKIKNESEYEEKGIKNAIHLDLNESEETSIMNEFLFSFLITKFYTNNETIIYIPKDLEIYIEIPNCFNDYLSQYGILNIFHRENINLENKPTLELSPKIIEIFDKLLGLNTNEAIEKKFLEKYMDNPKRYSYHQIIIFIKLFISLYNKFCTKLQFKEINEIGEQKDITEKCIQDFAKSAKYFIDGVFQNLIMKKIDENKLKKDKKDYFDLLSYTYENDIKDKKFDIPLIFNINENMIYEESDNIMNIIKNKNNSSKDYLLCLKKILNIPNEVETDKGNLKSLISILNYKTDNYVITNDNFTKMVLLYYRIKADIPVILIGETGCGKTSIIIKLSQILNNGEILVEKINIHPGINDEYICEKMKEMNLRAEKQEKELWIFFDEFNTCLSSSLLKKIFENKSFNDIKLHDNIRLIGACNPYRKKKEGGERFCYEKDNEDDDEKELVYSVQPLPQSLLNYVFNFGTLNEDYEKKYIFSIIENIFEKEEENLHEATKEVIFKCHKHLRELFDTSVVSLREISRFTKLVDFFLQYFPIKRNCDEIEDSSKDNMEQFDKIISIICSVYLCYYVRLTGVLKRAEFDNYLRESLIILVNSLEKAEKKDEDETGDKDKENLAFSIQNKKLRQFFEANKISHFSDLLKLEEKYLLDKIELKRGIYKNDSLKENTFLMFVAAITKIPLIIVGKPGTGKSISAQLICNSMRGEYSKDKFFREFPEIVLSYFQGSESTKTEDIEILFKIAENKLEFYKTNEEYKNKLPISMILFDELGLSGKSKNKPLKILHSKLEYAGNEEGVSFIGLSDYTLDAAKINRAMFLSVPNLEENIDQLISTTKCIVECISDELYDNIIFEILSRAYYEYKYTLNFIKKLTALKKYIELYEDVDIKNLDLSEIEIKKEYKILLNKENKIKEDFHSNRDLYFFIKGIAAKFSTLGSFDEVKIRTNINDFIERNFGGIDYEIDILLDLKLRDREKEIEAIKEILKEKILEKKKEKKVQRGKKEKVGNKDKKEKIKISSVLLFKKIYNMVCEEFNEKNYKLEAKEVGEYDLNRCIIKNISDKNSRYIILEIKPSLISLIQRNIELQNPDKEIVFIDGSPFTDDNNNEYNFIKLREIQQNANTGKLIIMQNLKQIHPFLYDMYNMNYIIKDEEKCVRICFDSFSESLTPVNDNFRIVILLDKKIVNQTDFAFLNRLEKVKIKFEKLLEDKQKVFSKKILEDIDFKRHIEANKINYELKDLLINCGKQEIQGLIYYEMKKNNKLDENIMEEIILNKIIKISCQDIISILPNGNKIKELYLNEKKYYNLKSYIDDLKDDSPKITIIYTFDSIAVAIVGIRSEMKFLISNIQMENQLERAIKEIKFQNEKICKESSDIKNNIIYIAFEQFNSNKIKFVSEYIKKYYKGDNYRYVFIIQIQRNFNPQVTNSVYSIPDTDPDIDQLFIDNLNGPNIKLRDLLKKNIKDILNDNIAYLNLENEFNRLLVNFVYEKRNKVNTSSLLLKSMSKSHILDVNNIKEKDKNYSDDILKYMENNNYLKEKIIEKAKNFLYEDKISKEKGQKLIDLILHINYIGKNSLDIISCLLNYIKGEIIGKYIKYIFSALEDNNILTTLIEIQNNKDKNNEIDGAIIKHLLLSILGSLTYDNKKEYNPKFLYNYIIPGFFNYYKNLSDYINKNLVVDYFNCEKNMRKYDSKANLEKKKNKLFKTEKKLLSYLYDYLCNENKFMFDNMKKINTNLLLKDYISFFLDKNDLKNEANNNLMEILLDLRFNPKNNKIIKENEKEPIKILLMKMIWIETNTNYILNILSIYSHAETLFNGNTKLFEIIKNKIFAKDKVKYIINKTRNPEYTREVNECFYRLLATICLCITEEEVKLTENVDNENNTNKIPIDQYLEVLKKVNIVLQDLNSNLNISLNEMYIIDELIAIIELLNTKKINIKKIKEMRKLLRNNASILQNDKPDEEKYSELVVNFENIYQKLIAEKIKEIKTEEDKNYENKYFDTLKYIYLKEINKIIDQNYRTKIFEKLILDKEIIRRSGDILQILLRKNIKTTTNEKDGFKSNLANLKKEDPIIKLIENNLLDSQEPNYFSLQETMLSFFEKSSFIYLNNIIEDKDFKYIDEKIPLGIFEDCVKFLVKYNFSDKLSREIRHIRKLFCIGYIKVYCYKFIKMVRENHHKIKEPSSIAKLLKNLSEKEKKMNEVIKLYLYKVIFNQSGKDFNVFLNKFKKKIYKFEEYKGFTDFFKINKEDNINYGFKTYDENFDVFYDSIEKHKKKVYDKPIIKDEIVEDSDNFIDNFINTSIILILSKLKNKDFELSEEYENYYNNICKPLFAGNEKLSIFIDFLLNPQKYQELKKYGIDSSNVESLFWGFRYCLNCFNEINEDDDDKIYSTLYDKNKISYLTEKCYPGSNPKYEPKYELYKNIIKHFKEKPNEGCYACLCEKGYIHSVPYGFPGDLEKDMKCPNCGQAIGSEYIEEEVGKICKIINRKDYVRIFNDEEEIDKIKEDEVKSKKLQEINYMTVDQFKKDYIIKIFNEDKGIQRIDPSYFRKEDKYTRELSQISFRLLNYILYSHLFFAKLYTGVSENFDKFLPTKIINEDKFERMSWGETLNECWNFLKKELLKKEIDSIEIFMNFTFKDLYTKLNLEECISDYESLISFEEKLEGVIKDKIKLAQDECKKYKKLIDKNSKDKNSFVSLLTEKMDGSNYSRDQYPNYDNFYYTDYLDEENVSKLFQANDLANKSEYVVLNSYLKYDKNKKINETKKNKEENYYSWDNINTFISVLNLFNEKYSRTITRQAAKNKILEEDEVYQQNKNKVEKFIKFFNQLQERENKKKQNKENKENKNKEENQEENKTTTEKEILKLDIKENHLSDILLDPENKYGKAYKGILQKIIETQNEKLSDLLEKISDENLNPNNINKINIQQIKEDEIFTFNMPDKFAFINEAFNSSYRKIIDNKNYEIYNQYEINYDSLEERLTNALVKNKKLLKDDIIDFIYKEEISQNEIADDLSITKKKSSSEKFLTDNKEIINKLNRIVKSNKNIYKTLIDDFMMLIRYIVNEKEDKVIISEVNEQIEEPFSPEFLKLFNFKKGIMANTILATFDYLLKLNFSQDEDDKIESEGDEEGENKDE